MKRCRRLNETHEGDAHHVGIGNDNVLTSSFNLRLFAIPLYELCRLCSLSDTYNPVFRGQDSSYSGVMFLCGLHSLADPPGRSLAGLVRADWLDAAACPGS